MGLYRLGLCLLLCSQCLFAETYWSYVPGVGSVQLTELSTEQRSLLATHLQLNAEQTRVWLNQLPDQLNAVSCSTLDVQNQAIPAYIDASYKVVSYAGVLKFYSEDNTKSTVWWLPWTALPALSQLKAQVTDLSLHMHQPLLITEQQLGSPGQLMIVAGSGIGNPNYFALQLNSLHSPELLWTLSSIDSGAEDLIGTMAQPLLMQEQRELAGLPALSLLLPNIAISNPTTLIYKVDLLTGNVQAKLGAEQTLPELSGVMALYDQNRDSVSESLLFSTKSGQIWQVQLEQNQFYGLQALADFSALKFNDIQFIRPLFAAVPVGGYGTDFHSRRSQWLVMLGALRQQHSVFVVLKINSTARVLSSDLVDRTLPDAPELAVLTSQDWQQIQQKGGWFSQLSGRLTHLPVVAGGVVYFSLLQQSLEQVCSIEQSSSALVALHLHHASAVYRRPILPLAQAAGPLKIKANAQGGFSLVEQHSQQVLVESLLEISPECAHCSKTIEQAGFPRWQLMGTYHNEEGAY